MSDHEQLIYDIGFEKIMALGVSRSRIHNWRKRGVSWQFRLPVAELAKSSGVVVPDNFLTPNQKV